MSEEKHFEKALSDMKDSFAGKDGIKHLAELGYSVRQIQESLDFPFPLDKIGRVLWDYYKSEEIILMKAPGSGAGSVRATYVKQTDAYGKQSFIKVPVEKEEGRDIRCGTRKTTRFSSFPEVLLRILLIICLIFTNCLQNGRMKKTDLTGKKR